MKELYLTPPRDAAGGATKDLHYQQETARRDGFSLDALSKEDEQCLMLLYCKGVLSTDKEKRVMEFKRLLYPDTAPRDEQDKDKEARQRARTRRGNGSRKLTRSMVPCAWGGRPGRCRRQRIGPPEPGCAGPKRTGRPGYTGLRAPRRSRWRRSSPAPSMWMWTWMSMWT